MDISITLGKKTYTIYYEPSHYYINDNGLYSKDGAIETIAGLFGFEKPTAKAMVDSFKERKSPFQTNWKTEGKTNCIITQDGTVTNLDLESFIAALQQEGLENCTTVVGSLVSWAKKKEI